MALNVEIKTYNSWLLSERVGPAVRFMQDQPLGMAMDLHSQHATGFATRVAASYEVTGLSERQIAALNNMIASRRWKEPPRWKPYAEIVPNHNFFVPELNQWLTEDYYRIWLCPGAVDQQAFNELRAARPDGMHAGATIGPLYAYTKDIDDPRLDPTPAEKRAGRRARYTTIVWQLVNRASERGMLIA